MTNRLNPGDKVQRLGSDRIVEVLEVGLSCMDNETIRVSDPGGYGDAWLLADGFDKVEPHIRNDQRQRAYLGDGTPNPYMISDQL